MTKKIITAALHVWIRGLLTYALLTMPAMFFFPMYIISILLAGLWSLPGLILFASLLWFLHHANPEKCRIIPIILSGTIFITAACTWGAAWLYTSGIDILHEYLKFLLFPLVGIISAVLAVMVRKQPLVELLHSTTSYVSQ